MISKKNFLELIGKRSFSVNLSGEERCELYYSVFCKDCPYRNLFYSHLPNPNWIPFKTGSKIFARGCVIKLSEDLETYTKLNTWKNLK